MSNRVVSVALLALAACSPKPPPAEPATVHASTPAPAASSASSAPAPKRFDADTITKTPAGASYEAPKGWTLHIAPYGHRLEDPEHDLNLSIVELENEPDANAAVAKAWKRLGSEQKVWPVRQSNTLQATDNWDSIVQISYEIPTQAHRGAFALAMRKGKVQYVILAEGAEAGFDRRGAQLGTIVSTFKAPGVQEESFAGKTAHALDAARLARVDAFMQHALDATKLPGAALAIVERGKIVYAKGFGTTEAGGKTKITPDTLFMIGSTTKSLTTLMMAELVDKNIIQWDEPLSRALPSFALADPSFTEKVTMRHTVCACTGLPRRDLDLFFRMGEATPESRLAEMKSITPTTGFGETFQYSNAMVSAGGYGAAHARSPKKPLGAAYDEAMRSDLFVPLGMKSTTFDFARATKVPHAMPHGVDRHEIYRPTPLELEHSVIAVRPAGAAWSNVNDLAKVVALELTKGKTASGAQLISEQNMLMRRTPQIKITDKMSYGHGLFIETDFDVPMIGHGGNNLGFTADLWFLPGHDMGVVLLMNGNGHANIIRSVLKRKMLEILFDGQELADKSLELALERRHKSNATALARLAAAKAAPEFLAQLVGTYTHPTLGALTVSRQGERAMLGTKEWKLEVMPLRQDDGAWVLEITEPPFEGLHLVPNGKTLRIDMPQQEYVFTRN